MNKSSVVSTLEELRRHIDALDQRILDLLEERFVLARSFAKDKPLEGSIASTLSASALPALRPQREHRILTHLLARCRNQELPDSLVVQLWRQLMSATAFAQRPYAISYQKDDSLSLVALGACFSPHITLLPQATQGEVIATLSQEANAFALVSLQATSPLQIEEERAPWWRYLFSTHAPRILQALPSRALPDRDRTGRVLLLGRLPSSFLDERAAHKFFLVNLDEAQADTPHAEREQNLRSLDGVADTKPAVLGQHEKTILVCCDEASPLTSAALTTSLSAWGEARHIGSTHDDWTTLSPAQAQRGCDDS